MPATAPQPSKPQVSACENHSASWATRFAAIAAVAAAASAFLSLKQLRDTYDNQNNSNTYQVQKDIIETTDQLIETSDEIRESKPGATSQGLEHSLNRKLTHLDGIFGAVKELWENGGMTDSSWANVLQGTCPIFKDLDYKVDGRKVTSVQVSCQANSSLWNGYQ